MTPFDRSVRATIYDLLVEGEPVVDVQGVAASGGWAPENVEESFRRLADQHRIALVPGEPSRLWMAHPFSGVETAHTAETSNGHWYANCAWDALAILALLGDGTARTGGRVEWLVRDGQVTPDGIVHFLVPARHFWDDIGFT